MTREPDQAPDGPDEGVVEEVLAPSPRRYPSTIGGVFYIGVLAVTLVGVGIAWGGDWRLGVRWIGAGLVVAAGLRLLLRQQDAGMLAVRHRLVDVALLAGVGGVLLFLAMTIPNQPV